MADVKMHQISWFDRAFAQFVSVLKHIITATNIWLLKKSNGRLGNSFLGVSVLLLYTIGCKSGLERILPLFYLQYEEKIILVASNGGNVRNPGWLNNITANPQAKVNVKGKEISVRAHLASEEEYQRYWPMVVKTFPVWEKFQKRSVRAFPLVVLEPC